MKGYVPAVHGITYVCSQAVLTIIQTIHMMNVQDVYWCIVLAVYQGSEHVFFVQIATNVVKLIYSMISDTSLRPTLDRMESCHVTYCF